VLSSDVKRSNDAADHSAQSNAEVQNGSTFTSLTHVVSPMYKLVQLLFMFILRKWSGNGSGIQTSLRNG
jgi:hypothetical protein